MAATQAIRALDRAGVRYRLHGYEHDPRVHGYGAEAARALRLDPRRVFKTLIAEVEGHRGVAALVAVSAQADLKALAAAAGAKRASLAPAATAQRLTGYVVGGISPLGQKRPLLSVVDVTALAWPTVFCSAGRRGLEVELAPGDLVAILGATTAAIHAD